MLTLGDLCKSVIVSARSIHFFRCASMAFLFAARFERAVRDGCSGYRTPSRMLPPRCRSGSASNGLDYFLRSFGGKWT